MTKLKVRKVVALVLCFFIVFAITANPAYARESNGNDNTQWKNDSVYLTYSEDTKQFENLNTSADNVETFNIAEQISLLHNRINYAYELLSDTLVDVSPGANTLKNRYWSTQEARDALIAAIVEAQTVLDAHGGGLQPGSLNIITHNSCFNIPVYEAEMELFINNERTVHKTEIGIISISDITAGSSVRFNISTPCHTLYQFPRWKVAEGDVVIPPFADSPEFIMSDGGLMIIAEFETIAEYYFDWNIDLAWDDDSADVLTGQFYEWDTDITFGITDASQPLEWSYDSEIELTKDCIEWVDVSASEPLEYFLGLEYGKVRHIPYTLNIDVDSSSVSPQSDPNTWTPSAIPSSRSMLLPFGLSWSATVTGNTPWLTISEQVRIPPHTNDSFVMNVDENFGNASRTGTIRVDFVNGATAEITVIQGHGTVLYLLGDTLSLPAVAAPPNIHSGGMVYVFTNANRRWNVDISGNAASWLSVGLFHPPNQTGIGEFAIMAQPNFGGQRTGTVTVSAQGVPGLSRTVTVVQAAGQVIILSADELDAPAFPYAGTVNVSSNTTWNMPTSNVSWLTISNITPPGRNGNGSFQINTTTANLGNSTRTGTITVSAIGAHPRTVRVFQAPGQGLVLSGEYWEAPANPSFANARVYSDRTWNMPVSNRDWLTITHVAPSNRSGNGSFRINAAPHTGNATRAGTVTITAVGAPTRSVSVVQHPGPVLVLSANSGASPAASTFGYVAVTSNRTWNATSNNPTWLRVDDFSPANRTGNGSFRISTTENTVTASRTGTITVTANGAPTRTITVTQAAAGPLRLSLSEWMPTSAPSNTVVRVSSGETWNVTSNVNWLTVSNFSPTNRTGNGTFIINAARNTGNASRTGIVTVTVGGVTRTITVTQTTEHRLLYTFSWNDDGDRKFLLTRAVEAAGGSTSWNTFQHIMNTSVYGVNVDFMLGTHEGISYVNGRGLAVRADVFYPRIVNAAGQLSFVGSHDVVIMDQNTGRRHAGIVMFASFGSDFYNNALFNPDINDPIYGGIRFATLGAGPEVESLLGGIYGNLWVQTNHPRDVGIVTGKSPNTNFIWVNATAGQIGNMITFDQHFRDNYNGMLTYNGVPGMLGGYNSNAYAYSLLRHAGIARPNLPTSGRGSFPGWDIMIPISYFREG